MNRKHRKPMLIGVCTFACAMMLSALAPALAFFGSQSEDSFVATFGKSEMLGGIITFSESDFTDRVVGSENLEGIVIATIPEGGMLRLAGSDVERGQLIDSSDISALSFIPHDEQAELFSDFEFIPIFSESGAQSGIVTVALSISNTPNQAPIAHDLEYATYQNVKLCGELRATDSDNDQCTFTITKQPEKGTVQVTSSGFTYIPDKDAKGNDLFCYTATDERGKVSPAAVVKITIEEPRSKQLVQYSDMQDSSAHYAALKLSENDIFSGERIGTESFFYPQEQVTRAQFVAMTAAVVELALPTVSVGTGLSDNESIPVWAQPYIAAAINSGIVYGEDSADGNRVFRADDPITRGEAATIIDRALDLADDGREMDFSDSQSVPSWAEQALINTTALDIISVFSDNTVRSEQIINREDVAMMLVGMIEHLENEQDKQTGGFFGLF